MNSISFSCNLLRGKENWNSQHENIEELQLWLAQAPNANLYSPAKELNWFQSRSAHNT